MTPSELDRLRQLQASTADDVQFLIGLLLKTTDPEADPEWLHCVEYACRGVPWLGGGWNPGDQDR